MRASFSDRFYIAAPQGVAVKLSDMLSSAQIIPSGVVHTGDEAVRAAKDGALLLTTYRLPDMTGEELASRLGEAADVVMIVPQDYEGEEAENVIMLHNPISQDALVQSLKTLAHCRLRMQQLRARAEKLSRTLEERKLIDRAKGKLMDTLHLTESEAHYRIQKASMDSGRRIADVAREILDSAEVPGQLKLKNEKESVLSIRAVRKGEDGFFVFGGRCKNSRRSFVYLTETGGAICGKVWYTGFRVKFQKRGKSVHKKGIGFV